MIIKRPLGFPFLLLVAAVMVLGYQASGLSGQGNRAMEPQLAEKELRRRIDTIIRRTVKQGEGRTREGVLYRRPVPPSSADIKEIQGYGERALPVLEEYVWGESTPEASVAIRFIGEAGGNTRVEVLGRVVEKHPSAQMRILALRWLGQSPRKLSLPIIKKAAETDPDASVRKLAKEILALD
jgi:hypothetical protein